MRNWILAAAVSIACIAGNNTSVAAPSPYDPGLYCANIDYVTAPYINYFFADDLNRKTVSIATVAWPSYYSSSATYPQVYWLPGCQNVRLTYSQTEEGWFFRCSPQPGQPGVIQGYLFETWAYVQTLGVHPAIGELQTTYESYYSCGRGLY